jgi:hypothetical protein
MNLLIKAFILSVCLCSLSSAIPSKLSLNAEIVKSDNTVNDLSLTFEKSSQSLSNKIEDNNNNNVVALERAELVKRLKNVIKNFQSTNTTTTKNATEEPQQRQKRQLAIGGGLGLGFGAYDYNDYYGDYMGDYAYDYYDWICTETECQLCDILTSECCDPKIDQNCYLPDSCINNPCLSGGTCISSKTIDGRPDFICACLPGLTGKYCQLANDYFVGAEAAIIGGRIPPPPPPQPQPVYPQYPPQPQYPQYVQQPPQYNTAPQQTYQPIQTAYAQPQQVYQPQQSYYPSTYGSSVLSGKQDASADGNFAATASRTKRGLAEDLLQILEEQERLVNKLQFAPESAFGCEDDCGHEGVCRFILWENGTKTSEKYCQCNDLTFGKTCTGRVNYAECQHDDQRRTSAGKNAPREYFVECTNNMPNVIKCDQEGSIFSYEKQACVRHSLKTTSNQQQQQLQRKDLLEIYL